MFSTITLEQARAIADAALRLPQMLQEVQDGQAGPGRVRSYTEAEIDTALGAVVAALTDAGYVVEAGAPIDTTMNVVLFDGEPYGTAKVEVAAGEPTGYLIRVQTTV